MIVTCVNDGGDVLGILELFTNLFCPELLLSSHQADSGSTLASSEKCRLFFHSAYSFPPRLQRNASEEQCDKVALSTTLRLTLPCQKNFINNGTDRFVLT